MPEVLSFEQCVARFTGVFQELTREHNFAEVWADFVEIAAIAMHNFSYRREAIERNLPKNVREQYLRTTLEPDEAFEVLENRYLSALVPKYERSELEKMRELVCLSEYAVKSHRRDFLGRLYQDLDLAGSSQRGAKGEFFTPDALSQIIAGLLVPSKLDAILEEKGFITVQEPACGSGGMVIALIERLFQLNYNPHAMVYIDAIDINKVMFHMAYFQISALDVSARVWWGNTLSLKMKQVWSTPHLRLSRHIWEHVPAFLMLRFIRELDARSEAPRGSEEAEVKAAPGGEKVAADEQHIEPPFTADEEGQLRLF
jgi:hypothetical protein